MTESNHNKRLSEVLSHAKCPRCNSNDKEDLGKWESEKFCDIIFY